jgi:hypothetical protein
MFYVGNIANRPTDSFKFVNAIVFNHLIDMKNALTIAVLLLVALLPLAAPTAYAQAAKKSSGKKGSAKPATAEAKPAPAAESAIAKLTRDFVAAYGRLTETKDKQAVLQYMHEKVTSDLVNASISGRVRNFNSDFEGFDSHLNRLVNAEGLKLSYQLKNLVQDYQSEQVGVTAYTAEYQMERDGSVWERGNETVTLTLRKFNNEWKIVHYATVTLEDEKLRGDCFCEVFESRPGNFVTKTIVPGGRNYDALLHNFEFLSRQTGRAIKVDALTFRWEDNGDIYADDAASASRVSSVASQAAAGRLLGNAVEKADAIFLILREYFYKENCANIKIRKK